jgi:acyl carrier protein
MSKKAILSDYIKQEFLRDNNADLGADQDLISSGIIDSIGILQLVAFIDERFGISVPDEDVVFEHFQSVESLSDYLEEKNS